MTDVNIRKVNTDEYPEVVEVFVNSFIGKELEQSRYDRILQRIKLIIESNLTEFTFLEYNDKIVGLGGETRYIGSSFIGYIGVLPNYRKRGFGSLIFEKILEEAKNYNQTIELFANIGADKIYQQFGFTEEYLTNIYTLNSSSSDILIDDIDLYDSIPNWVFELDKEALGFNRSKLLSFLKTESDSELIGIGTEGFAFCRNSSIGPLIAKNDKIAKKLINYFTLKDKTKIILSAKNEKILEIFTPMKTQTCIKMIFGHKLQQQSNWIIGFNAFATS